MNERLRALAKRLAGYQYVLLVAAVGLALMLWPSGGGSGGGDDTGAASSEEARIAGLLTGIEGVGQARVLLSDSGAVVVCAGADSAAVRLRVTQAVRCYTGLGADDIVIFILDQHGG